MSNTITDLTKKLTNYLEPEQVDIVRRAYFCAERAHSGQVRRSGEPYVTHPLAVAGILADMHMDHQSLAAAMLHDVIEDTSVDKSVLTDEFGATVAELVVLPCSPVTETAEFTQPLPVYVRTSLLLGVVIVTSDNPVIPVETLLAVAALPLISISYGVPKPLNLALGIVPAFKLPASL